MTSMAYRVATVVVPTISVGVASAVAILPNTLWLNKMKAVMHAYK